MENKIYGVDDYYYTFNESRWSIQKVKLLNFLGSKKKVVKEHFISNISHYMLKKGSYSDDKHKDGGLVILVYVNKDKETNIGLKFLSVEQASDFYYDLKMFCEKMAALVSK